MVGQTSSADENGVGIVPVESVFRAKLRAIFNRYQEQWELRGLGHDQIEAIARDTDSTCTTFTIPFWMVRKRAINIWR